MDDFAEQLKKESENIIDANREIIKRVAISGFSDAIRRSPVGNPDLWATDNPPAVYVGGMFRSNWFLSFDAAINKTTKSITSAGEKISGITKGILADKTKFNYVLSNSLPYAQALEAGHSTQAPNGIVAPVIVKMRRDLPKIAKLVYKKRGIEK